MDSSAAIAPVAPLADSVNAIIATALEGRPDLAASRAEVEAALAGMTEARGALLPSLGFSATGGRTYATTIPDGANSYILSLGLTIPLFNGFSRQYDLRAARVRGRGRPGPHRDRSGRKWSSRCSAPTTRSRPPPAGWHRGRPPRERHPVERGGAGRYKAGVGSVLDLLAAQSALASARAQQVDARLAWSVSLAQLAHDAGVLDPGVESPLRLTTDTTAAPPR